MKGIVFTEFLDYVEAAQGSDTVDDIIEDCNFPHKGAYTAVGTYDYREMVALVTALSTHTATPVPDVLCSFGRHMCARFAHLYPDFFSRKTCLFDFLESVNDHIHVEVHKLYPDAELPSFSTHARVGRNLELDYRSCRPLASLAEGLIQGASDHYKQPVSISQERHEERGDAFVRFAIEQI